MSIRNDLFVEKIALEREKILNKDVYPFNIELIKNFEELKFNSKVTFLVGENGVGKSTFIEAIAVCCGLNPEGGTQNFMFSTSDTHSNLNNYLTLYESGRPRTKFFLRAESFYNVATEIMNIKGGPCPLHEYYGGNLHECSHGESFIKLVENRFTDHGLYILDEPEAALSPQRQLALLCLINQLAKEGSQFIIATHSPILISYREGKILDLNNNFKEIKYKDTDIYSLYKMYLDKPDAMQHRLFD